MLLAGSAYAQQIQIVTDKGNVFNVDASDDAGHDSSSDDNPTISGMGINSRIIQKEYEGVITHGQGMIGEIVSLKPYHAVDESTDFASIVLKDDLETIHVISDFGAKYRYENDMLQKTSETKPNILSYSQSRTINGSSDVSINPDGIVVSGDGTVILEIDDSLRGSTLLLRGDSAVDGTVKIIESPYDLVSLPYVNGKGFKVYETTQRYDALISSEGHSSGGRGWCCIYWTVHTVAGTVPINALVSSQENFYGEVSYTTFWETYQKYYAGFSQGYQYRWVPYTSSYNASLVPTGTVDGDGFYNSSSGQFNYSYTSNQHHFDLSSTARIYDKGIPAKSHIEFTGEFEKPFHLADSDDRLYLVVNPNGSTISIKGETHDVNELDFLHIDGIPANIPYRITDAGFVGVAGITSADGIIALSSSQIDSLDSNPGGILHLYPDSMSYRGPFSTVAFDEANQQTIRIESDDDKVYMAHAWAQIPVIGSVSVKNVNLDGVTDLTYLNGDYQDGQYIRVPVIPGFKTIHLEVNNVKASLSYSDILGGTGIKIASPATSTITEYDLGSAVPSIESTTGTTTFAMATAEGTLKAIISAQISGTSDIANTITLNLPPPPPPPPARADPLSAWVDVYKNGTFVKKIEMFFDDTPDFTPGATLDAANLKYVQTASYQYDQSAISGNVEIDVMPGDFVEIYLYAKIHADGIAVQIPPGFVMNGIASQASATANIHSSSITTSM